MTTQLLDISRFKRVRASEIAAGHVLLHGGERVFGLKVQLPEATGSQHGAVVFGLVNGDRFEPPTVLDRVDNELCVDLGPAVFTAEVDSARGANPPLPGEKGMLICKQGLVIAAAVVYGQRRGVQLFGATTGNMVDRADDAHAIRGWRLGVRGFEGEFIELVRDVTTAGQ